MTWGVDTLNEEERQLSGARSACHAANISVSIKEAARTTGRPERPRIFERRTRGNYAKLPFLEYEAAPALSLSGLYQVMRIFAVGNVRMAADHSFHLPDLASNRRFRNLRLRTDQLHGPYRGCPLYLVLSYEDKHLPRPNGNS